jgi:hypothetical protein
VSGLGSRHKLRGQLEEARWNSTIHGFKSWRPITRGGPLDRASYAGPDVLHRRRLSPLVPFQPDESVRWRLEPPAQAQFGGTRISPKKLQRHWGAWQGGRVDFWRRSVTGGLVGNRIRLPSASYNRAAAERQVRERWLREDARSVCTTLAPHTSSRKPHPCLILDF